MKLDAALRVVARRTPSVSQQNTLENNPHSPKTHTKRTVKLSNGGVVLSSGNGQIILSQSGNHMTVYGYVTVT